MPFENILLDTWAADRATLLDDTFLIAEIIWGHLIHHLSNPGVFLTWRASSPRQIQALLMYIAVHHPLVKPSCALRAMLVVLSIKETAKHGVAYGFDAEILWHMAFRSLAARHDPRFTRKVFTTVTRSRFAKSKMERSPNHIEGDVLLSLTEALKPRFDAKVAALQRYWLAPWISGVDQELVQPFFSTTKSPAMPNYVLIKPRLLARAEQTLIFPPVRRQCHLQHLCFTSPFCV